MHHKLVPESCKLWSAIAYTISSPAILRDEERTFAERDRY